MKAKDAKFQFEFMLMMLMAGRNEQASVAAGKVADYLEAQAEKENEDA